MENRVKDADARRAAQRRVDRIAQFRDELAELEREGGLTLDAGQRDGLERHLTTLLETLTRDFGADATDSARRISWGMRMASTLGLGALVVAVVLFLHRVWGYMPVALQVGVLVAAPLAVLGCAAVACVRGVDRYYVALLGIATAVGFQMELEALGTLLNTSVGAGGWLAYGLVALIFGYATGVRLLLGAGLVELCVFVAMLCTIAEGGHSEGFVLRAQYLLPPAAVCYGAAWMVSERDGRDARFVLRWCGAAVGFVGLLLLSTLGHLCCGGMGADTVGAAWQLLGLAAGGAVVFHGIRVGRAGLVNLGGIGFAVFLFVRLHAWCWDWMPKYAFFLLIGLTLMALLVVFRRLRTGLRHGGGA